MNIELKTQWVEALRSDRYQQTFGYFHDRSGFCAIGVFLDIAAPDSWRVRDNGSYWLSIPSEVGMDSSSFMESIGITGHYQNIISRMNDISRKSFREIADYIEVTL